MKETLIRPTFLDQKHIQLSVDTSGYCQARCQECVWPELRSAKRIMTLGEFGALLDSLDGFSFEELALNSINEPFVDKTILEKLRMIIERRLPVRSLFFSSNWLLPNDAKIKDFAQIVATADETPEINWVSINATASGIDHRTYDVLQAGIELENAAVPYRALNFELAVHNIVLLAKELEARLNGRKRMRLHIKAYGDLFDQETYHAIWRTKLLDAGVSQAFFDRHIQVLLNHAFQTFGRADADLTPSSSRRVCMSKWLDTQIVVGPDGKVGLCCIEGAHKVNVVYLLRQSLAEVVNVAPYQRLLRVLSGAESANPGDPCANCEYFVRVAK